MGQICVEDRETAALVLFCHSRESCFSVLVSSAAAIKMSESEAKDAFIIFDESYEGNDVDAHYLADILRAVGCNVSNAAAVSHGWTESVGEKRITFDDFSATILPAVKADLSSTGCKEDYVEGLKVFDKDMTGKVPLGEVVHCLSSLGEKLEADEVERLMKILSITEDDFGWRMFEKSLETIVFESLFQIESSLTPLSI